jgi:hypothetical protein
VAADREVIKELLVALGFTIQDVGLKKFTGTLESISKTAAVTAGAIASVTVAAEAMVTRFASEFERLYYASQRTGATVKNIRAIEFAAGQVGLTAEQVSQAMESMARSIRENPGLRGLLQKLGINPESKNLLTDFVTRLSKMPFYISRMYGQMFGFDSDTLFMLTKFLPQFLAAQEKSKEIDTLGGLTEEKLQGLASDAKDFNNNIRELYKIFGLMGDMLASTILPYFHDFNGALKEIMYDVLSSDLTVWEASWRKVGAAIGFTADNMERAIAAWETIKSIGSAFFEPYNTMSRAATGHNLFRSEEEKRADAVNETPGRMVTGKIGGLGGTSTAHATPDRGRAQSIFANLEAQFGLPPGLLDKVWSKESARGAHTETSSAGAKGQFQFLPETGARYGLKGADFYNIKKSATAAAHYIADLVQQYGGNLNMAMGAYHGESGLASKYALGSSPSGFSPYVRDTAGGTHVIINQQTDITVEGAGDPATTAKRVGAEQSRVNGDIVRTFSAVPR